MSYRAVVIDQSAISFLLASEEVTSKWLDSLQISAPNGEVVLKRAKEVAYLLGRQASEHSRLLVIRSEGTRLFNQLGSDDARVEAFKRTLRGGLRVFDQTVTIPREWKPFHRAGRYISFQSNHFGVGTSDRVYLDPHPAKTNHVFAYFVGQPVDEAESSTAYIHVFRQAIDSYRLALASQSERIDEHSAVLDLSEQMQEEFTQGLNAKQWFDLKLTTKQRAFVERPLGQSIRLQGPAGSGKTLAMVLKALLLAYEALDRGSEFRICYLTHSQATADMVRSMMEAIDDRGVLFSDESKGLISVTTLLSLATNAMSFDMSGLEPVDNDALKGRTFQMEMIQLLLAEYRAGDWRLDSRGCTEVFRKYIDADIASNESRYFCWELMNEFACVLDADNVRDSKERRHSYLKGVDRKKWMMQLETEDERRVVLQLYDLFRRFLRDNRSIGVDQIIYDYAGYLDSFRWDAVRRESGFDVIFADEFHLFSRQDRSVLQHLFRNPDDIPTLLMAYDVKQSPRDTFVGVSAGESERFNLWKNANLPASERIELQDVFRYTPQIGAFLDAIDKQSPALNFDEDWPTYSGVSRRSDGPTVSFVETQDWKETYRLVFGRAMAAATLLKKGRRVAVLGYNEERLRYYVESVEFKDKFVLIESRDDFSALSYAGKRFVLSAPVFVAGLQFDTTFLIDVNDDAVPFGPGSGGATARFLRSLYLGASRAERRLEIYGTSDRGGLSRFLDKCLQIAPKAVSVVAPGDLPRID